MPGNGAQGALSCSVRPWFHSWVVMFSNTTPVVGEESLLN